MTSVQFFKLQVQTIFICLLLGLAYAVSFLHRTFTLRYRFLSVPLFLMLCLFTQHYKFEQSTQKWKKVIIYLKLYRLFFAVHSNESCTNKSTRTFWMVPWTDRWASSICFQKWSIWNWLVISKQQLWLSLLFIGIFMKIVNKKLSSSLSLLCLFIYFFFLAVNLF